MLQEFSTLIERYLKLSTETFGSYIKDTAVKHRLTLNYCHFMPFGHESFNLIH